MTQRTLKKSCGHIRKWTSGSQDCKTSHCEVLLPECPQNLFILVIHFHVYTHPLQRSGLLTFFSSLVIQECLINCAGERQRSKKSSHCELFFVFCLSASYPRHSNSKKQKRKTSHCEVLLPNPYAHRF